MIRAFQHGNSCSVFPRRVKSAYMPKLRVSTKGKILLCGGSQMKLRKGLVLAVMASALLMFGGIRASRAAQQSGSSTASDQTDSTATTKKKSKKATAADTRSEERRVGKEGRSR